MHADGNAHRDIKTQNILMHDGNPKICDLGFIRNEDDIMQTECGTYPFMAPEVARN